MADHTNTAPGWCCVDCLFLEANGETPPEMTEEETSAWLDKVAEAGRWSLGRMFGQEGCEHTSESWDVDPEPHAEQCEQIDFSSRPCDVCGSTLGGAREAVTFWL